MFDTRNTVYLLLDYKEYYGQEKTLADAAELIKDIPSITLLNYISGFSVNLYLNEHNDHSGKIQAYMVDSIIRKTGEAGITKWLSVIQKQVGNGHAPMLIWNYSNLLFYSILFQNFNQLPSRDLTALEAQSFLESYLIINSIANKKIKIEEHDIAEGATNNSLDEVLMSSFIYQKDYASSTDYTNQVTRGIRFFQYLENHAKFAPLVKAYYQSKNVSGYLRMFKNLMTLFSELKIEDNLKPRNQIANLAGYMIGGDVDPAYIDTLCINSEIPNCKDDERFGSLRNKFLFKINQFEYFILNVNFLIDHFYKAQIFSFNSFLKAHGFTDDFLAIKAKEFMEDIYLPEVMNTCFPTYIKYYGDGCQNSKGDQLCDAYLREGNKICLIEFKDVLLNSSVKNSADKEQLLNELDKKFVANQRKKPKGITQLLNAVQDINLNSVAFDTSVQHTNSEIYPVVLYTDFTFGIEGLNKIYREKFKKGLKAFTVKNLVVHDVTFINLNFFEIREDYLHQGLLNLFTMLAEFQQHVQHPNYQQTNFEVFSRFYMHQNVSQNLPLPLSFQRSLHEILLAK